MLTSNKFCFMETLFTKMRISHLKIMKYATFVCVTIICLVPLELIQTFQIKFHTTFCTALHNSESLLFFHFICNTFGEKALELRTPFLWPYWQWFNFYTGFYMPSDYLRYLNKIFLDNWNLPSYLNLKFKLKFIFRIIPPF